ncbi:MAG: histidinol dehydrogenase, partial [Deltaproteobacteria bacterium]|nr:histidinol dehydrogenase [Deltaproteobacteria bacterium]
MSDMRMIPEKLADLSESDRRAIMGRSMEDISSLYEYVRGLVMDVRERGDQALVESNREYREDTTAADLVVSPDEIGAAYEKVEDGVVEALKAAAGHIKSFHEAQLGRQMWSVEVSKGVLAGRITRPLDRVG